MTWTKLSDDYTDDTWALSDEAFRLHTEGLVWSNRKLLDLRLPKEDVRRFSKHPDSVAELLAGEWWVDDGDAYVIRHHARYQRLRDAVIRQQEANRENQAKRGKKTSPAREVRFNESNNDSLNDPRSESTRENDSFVERDRTGQAGITKGSGSELFVDEATGEITDDPAPSVPAAWGARTCRVCGTEIPADSPVPWCPKQDDEHNNYRAQAA